MNQFEREANRQQIMNLERSHSKEMEIKEYQKEQLKKSLIQKDSEVFSEKVQKSQLEREIRDLSQENLRKQQEANLWKTEA